MKKINLVLVSLLLPAVAFAQANPISNMIYKLANYLGWILISFSVLFIVLSGFYFVLARGEESKLSAARSMLLWSILGLAVGLMAPYLVNIVIGFIPK